MRKIREIKDLRNFSATRYIVLSRASTHPRASVHPPISTVLWFFKVLHVTSHHAKFLCSESKNRSTELTHRCDYSDELQATTTSGSNVLHTPVCSFICSVPHLQYWNSHTASDKQLQKLGNEATGRSAFGPQYSFGLDEAWAKWQCWLIWYPQAANFTSGMGACTVEPFKHLLHATAHPFWCLSCDCPWALARYNTVCIYNVYI